MSVERKLRETAAALLSAVNEARAEGLSVQWPSRPEGLASLAISETARFAPAVDGPRIGVTVPADGVTRETFLAGDGAGEALPALRASHADSDDGHADDAAVDVDHGDASDDASATKGKRKQA
jgi:hypothetical protein